MVKIFLVTEMVILKAKTITILIYYNAIYFIILLNMSIILKYYSEDIKKTVEVNK